MKQENEAIETEQEQPVKKANKRVWCLKKARKEAAMSKKAGDQLYQTLLRG